MIKLNKELKMRLPTRHTAEAIQCHSEQVEINNKWYLARPEPYYKWTRRFSLAWAVFTGKADALFWIKQ